MQRSTVTLHLDSMKKLLLISTVVFIVTVIQNRTNAQGIWSPPGATWYYSYSNNFAVTGYVKISYLKDTTINSKNCKALLKEIYWYDYITSTFGGGIFDTAYTYLQNDTVFHFRNNQFYILYDFNGQPTNVWQVAENYSMCAPDSFARVKVDSIGVTNINSTNLKWTFVSPAPNSYYGYYGKIVERIGCVDFYMFPEFLGCIADVNEGGQFRCYYDSTFGLYQKATAPSCNFIVGIEELFSNSKPIVIFPNPFSTQTVLQTDNLLHNATLTVYNSHGQTVKEIKNISGQTVTLFRDNLPSGLYFLRLTENNKLLAVDKLVITDK